MKEDDEYAANEGREFLPLILEGEALEIDLEEKDDWEIITWLEELGYRWNGGSWIAA
jgi:hypothetical protein